MPYPRLASNSLGRMCSDGPDGFLRFLYLKCEHRSRPSEILAVQRRALHSHFSLSLLKERMSENVSWSEVGCALARAEQPAKISLGIAAHFHAVTDRIYSIERRSANACAHSLIVMLHLRGARASRSQLRVHAQ